MTIEKKINGNTNGIRDTVLEEMKRIYDMRMTGDDFARAAGELAASGAAIMGGCCGTCEAHIAALAGATAGLAPIPLSPTKSAVAASLPEA